MPAILSVCTGIYDHDTGMLTPVSGDSYLFINDRADSTTGIPVNQPV